MTMSRLATSPPKYRLKTIAPAMTISMLITPIIMSFKFSERIFTKSQPPFNTADRNAPQRRYKRLLLRHSRSSRRNAAKSETFFAAAPSINITIIHYTTHLFFCQSLFDILSIFRILSHFVQKPYDNCSSGRNSPPFEQQKTPKDRKTAQRRKNRPKGGKTAQGRFATKPISRVLSCAEIYLGESSPKRSSRRCNAPAEQTITHCSKMTLHRTGFTWQRGLPRSGELLPRLSTLAGKTGGISLLHFP